MIAYIYIIHIHLRPKIDTGVRFHSFVSFRLYEPIIPLLFVFLHGCLCNPLGIYYGVYVTVNMDSKCVPRGL